MNLIRTMHVTCTLLAATSVAASESIALLPAKDATLYASATGALANGTGQYIFSGATSFGDARRALLNFDVASSLPIGATIDSVTLSLNVSMTISFSQLHGLHRVTQDWTEGDVDPGFEEGGGEPSTPGSVTWIHASMPDTLWSTEGGDFLTAPSATAMIDTGPASFDSSAGMVADVQDWLDDPGTNFGWIILGNESTVSTAKRFDSLNNPVDAVRPRLTIEFTPVPGDANGDGQVTGADFTVWGDNFGLHPGDATFRDGDFNDDGFVTGADFTIWADNFGTMGDPHSVPEPASVLLACVASLALLARFARKARRAPTHIGGLGSDGTLCCRYPIDLE